jgi:hypothetical protein
MNSQAYIAAGSFTNVTGYNFEVGYFGGSIISRNFLDGTGGTTTNYNNIQNNLTMVYSSGGTPNLTNLNFYAAVNLAYTSYTATPIWGITTFYTRIA